MWTALAQRSRSPLLWVLLALALLYLATLFPGVGGRINGGDSAKFQFIGLVGGIGHPPGSPLYLLLNALWVRVPWPCSPALRVTLLSLLFGMVSLVVIGRALALTFGPRAALCGVIALGLGPLFWTLTTEAELYTLNAALVAGSCAAALRFDKTGDSRALFTCMALSLLGCANHLTAVMLLPAAASLLWSGRLSFRQRVGLCAVALLSAATYAYVPLRAHSAAPYSEWTERSFWEYVSASKFQAGFAELTLDKIVHARMPAVASELQKQWAWPVLLLIPFGLVRLRERAPHAARFVSVALLGLLGFALLYKIPDPAGFYLPIVTLLALPLSLACTSGRGWRLAVLALLLGVSSWQHLRSARGLVGNEVVYSLGDHKLVAWDLDDVFERMPQAAYFAQPCEAYGCVELINYFRFADSTVQRRNIRFAQLPSVRSYYYAYAPMDALPWEAGQREVICTLRKGDASALRKHGAEVRTIERPARHIAGKDYPGVPIFCTEPGLAKHQSLRGF